MFFFYTLHIEIILLIILYINCIVCADPYTIILSSAYLFLAQIFHTRCHKLEISHPVPVLTYTRTLVSLSLHDRVRAVMHLTNGVSPRCIALCAVSWSQVECRAQKSDPPSRARVDNGSLVFLTACNGGCIFEQRDFPRANRSNINFIITRYITQSIASLAHSI